MMMRIQALKGWSRYNPIKPNISYFAFIIAIHLVLHKALLCFSQSLVSGTELRGVRAQTK